jgi:hypothetical protein
VEELEGRGRDQNTRPGEGRVRLRRNNFFASRIGEFFCVSLTTNTGPTSQEAVCQCLAMFSFHISFSAALQKTQRTAISQQVHCDVCSNTVFESFAHALCGSNKALIDPESSFKSALELFWR